MTLDEMNQKHQEAEELKKLFEEAADETSPKTVEGEVVNDDEDGFEDDPETLMLELLEGAQDCLENVLRTFGRRKMDAVTFKDVSDTAAEIAAFLWEYNLAMVNSDR